jgi:hypothetical protein
MEYTTNAPFGRQLDNHAQKADCWLSGSSFFFACALKCTFYLLLLISFAYIYKFTKGRTVIAFIRCKMLYQLYRLHNVGHLHSFKHRINLDSEYESWWGHH